MSLSLALSVLNDDTVADPVHRGAAHVSARRRRARRIRSRLEGVSYRDAAAGGVEGRQEEAELQARRGRRAGSHLLRRPAPLEVRERSGRTRVAMTGFTDVVVWNPGEERAAALTDLEPGGWLRMLCVEAAAIGTPVRLEPGERWTGQQTLTRSDCGWCGSGAGAVLGLGLGAVSWGW